MNKDEINSFFSENGYVVLKNFFTLSEVKIISIFVEKWINKNISDSLNINQNNCFLKINDISNYHNFIVKNDIDHSKIASAKYRYINPPEKIRNLIQKKLLFEYLKIFSGFKSYKECNDPGLGWLGYRIIRADSNDGYPPSCKNWGPSKNVYSVWLPIAGCNKNSNIRLLPKSHKKTFKKYLPKNSKFLKGEYRLDENIAISEFNRPEVPKNGVIIFHPDCIHSEDTSDLFNTRLNLEYRFKPFKEL